MTRLSAFRSRRNRLAGPSVVGSEFEEPLPKPYTRPASEVALTKGDEPGEYHDEICRQVMWLQLVKIKKIPEERAGGEAEPTLKVCEKDHPLASTSLRHDLDAGSAPLDLGRELTSMNQRLDVVGGHLGALP